MQFLGLGGFGQDLVHEDCQQLQNWYIVRNGVTFKCD